MSAIYSVCTNDRQEKRKSCAEGDNKAIRSFVKDEIKNRDWTGQVCVSQCGCMGLYMKGPNVIIYPQKIWFSHVTESDLSEILVKVESQLVE